MCWATLPTASNKCMHRIRANGTYSISEIKSPIKGYANFERLPIYNKRSEKSTLLMLSMLLIQCTLITMHSLNFLHHHQLLHPFDCRNIKKWQNCFNAKHLKVHHTQALNQIYLNKLPNYTKQIIMVLKMCSPEDTDPENMFANHLFIYKLSMHSQFQEITHYYHFLQKST